MKTMDYVLHVPPSTLFRTYLASHPWDDYMRGGGGGGGGGVSDKCQL